jgi:hypothetical protein
MELGEEVSVVFELHGSQNLVASNSHTIEKIKGNDFVLNVQLSLAI